MENFRVRLVSAVLLAAVALLLTWLGGAWFRLLAAAVGVAVYYEWSAMSRNDANRPQHFAAAGLIAIFMVLLVAGVDSGTMLALAVAGIAVSAAHGFARGSGYSAAAGLAYASLPAIAISFLRGSDMAGLSAVLFLFAVVWATDIFAYFGGRLIGGPKLAPAVSPSKTWSGAASGLIGGVAAGAAVALAFGTTAGMLAILAVAIFLSVLSQGGDLVESAFKRRYGVKDSGNLIPGHGGFMDRVDGLIFAAVGLYAACSLVAGTAFPSRAIF